MTALMDIEIALVQRLSMLRLGTAGAFKTIDGLAGPGTSRVVDYVSGRLKPAALIRYLGRKRGSSGEPALVSFFVACESLRGGGEARTGGEGVAGAHRLLDLLRGALDGTTLLCGCRLAFSSEGAVVADDRVAVFQQTYEVEETP